MDKKKVLLSVSNTSFIAKINNVIIFCVAAQRIHLVFYDLLICGGTAPSCHWQTPCDHGIRACFYVFFSRAEMFVSSV
jgi:hypothetical protein